MSGITPFLWYDTQAREAAELYASAIPDSRVLTAATLEGTPSGSVETVSIELGGRKIDLMSAGPHFRFTPAISFMVACESREEVDTVWAKLADGGEPLMDLGSYPFSEWYGWTRDRYGLSWQVMHMGARPIRQRIITALMFVGDVCGRAEEAMTFYTSLFDESTVEEVTRYVEGESLDAAGTVKFARFTIAGGEFAVMDSAYEHQFGFNEAISLVVRGDNQEEIDRYWSLLSADPEAEQCGWLKDRFGVSWQIVPSALDRMLTEGDPPQRERVTRAFLSMKKLDIAALEKAFRG